MSKNAKLFSDSRILRQGILPATILQNRQVGSVSCRAINHTKENERIKNTWHGAGGGNKPPHSLFQLSVRFCLGGKGPLRDFIRPTG